MHQEQCAKCTALPEPLRGLSVIEQRLLRLLRQHAALSQIITASVVHLSAATHWRCRQRRVAHLGVLMPGEEAACEAAKEQALHSCQGAGAQGLLLVGPVRPAGQCTAAGESCEQLEGSDSALLGHTEGWLRRTAACLLHQDTWLLSQVPQRGPTAS